MAKIPPPTNVEVPIGLGIERGKHDWKARPPNAKTLENLDLRQEGAYAKVPGWRRLVNLSVDEARYGAVLPQKHSVGLLTSSGAQRVEGGKLVSQPFGGQIPVEVVQHEVAGFRGTISDLNIARNEAEGLTAIVCGVADPQFSGSTDTNQMFGAVVDDDWNVVWGPHPIGFNAPTPGVGYATRVEPLGTGFVFFGVRPGEHAGTSDFLYALVVQDPANAGLPGAMVPVGDDGVALGRIVRPSAADYPLWYDTYADPDAPTRAYVVWQSFGIGTDPAYWCTYVEADGTQDTSLLDTDPSLTRENLVVWYDTPTDTVLVYSHHYKAVAYNTGTFSAGPWALSAASSATIEGDHPCFYRDHAGIRLNDYAVSLAGTAPATPSFGAPFGDPIFLGARQVLHRRPQPNDYSAWKFRRYRHVNQDTGGDRLVTGQDWLLYETPVDAQFHVGAYQAETQAVVPLGQGRKDLAEHDHFHRYRAIRLDGEQQQVEVTWLVGQIAQSARKGTGTGASLLVPQALAARAGKAPPLWVTIDDGLGRVDTSVHGGDANYGSEGLPGSVSSAAVGRASGAGLDTGLNAVVITEIRLRSREHSFIDHYGTLLCAAGGLHAFDGTLSFPAFIETPYALNIDPNETDYPIVRALINFPLRLEGSGGNTGVNFKGVLLATDRNGVTYRSAPFDMSRIENETGGVRAYYPEWTFFFRESALNTLLQPPFRLQVEIYATEEWDISDPLNEPEEYNLLTRTGVKLSGSDFVADGYGVFDINYTTALDPPDFDLFDVNPTPLYTLSGELPPTVPPASNVLVQAGNYLFLLSSEDPYDVWVSKPLGGFLGPEFNPLLRLTAPSESGGIVSLAGESDRLLLLCKNGVWEVFVGGDGPDANGAGAFPAFRKVWGGEGCVNHRGTVTGPFGTFFLADSGPRIVSRDGTVQDVGAALGPNTLDPDSVTRAVYLPEEQQIHVFTETRAHVFDLGLMGWTSTTQGSAVVAERDGTIYRVPVDTQVLRVSDENATEDGSTLYHAKYVSPWITFAGPMSYQRVRRFGVLVRRLGGAGALRVSIAYDYVDTDIDTREVTSTTMDALDRPVQISVRTSRQKADAYRITVEEVPLTVGQTTLGNLRWELVGIEAEVRGKAGVIKLESGAFGGEASE